MPENADCEYAVQNRIAEASVFKFLVEDARHCRATHAIDEQNGNTQWRNAIAKKLKNSMVAFDILISGAPESGRYLST